VYRRCCLPVPIRQQRLRTRAVRRRGAQRAKEPAPRKRGSGQRPFRRACGLVGPATVLATGVDERPKEAASRAAAAARAVFRSGRRKRSARAGNGHAGIRIDSPGRGRHLTDAWANLSSPAREIRVLKRRAKLFVPWISDGRTMSPMNAAADELIGQAAMPKQACAEIVRSARATSRLAR